MYHIGVPDDDGVGDQTAMCVSAGLAQTTAPGDVVVPKVEVESTQDGARWFNCPLCLVVLGGGTR